MKILIQNYVEDDIEIKAAITGWVELLKQKHTVELFDFASITESELNDCELVIAHTDDKRLKQKGVAEHYLTTLKSLTKPLVYYFYTDKYNTKNIEDELVQLFIKELDSVLTYNPDKVKAKFPDKHESRIKHINTVSFYVNPAPILAKHRDSVRNRRIDILYLDGSTKQDVVDKLCKNNDLSLYKTEDILQSRNAKYVWCVEDIEDGCTTDLSAKALQVIFHGAIPILSIKQKDCALLDDFLNKYVVFYDDAKQVRTLHKDVMNFDATKASKALQDIISLYKAKSIFLNGLEITLMPEEAFELVNNMVEDAKKQSLL